MVVAISINSTAQEPQQRKFLLNNETCLYEDPDAPLDLKPGDPHPKADGWFFFNAHEFLPQDTANGMPKGFIQFNTPLMFRAAYVDNKTNSCIIDGALTMWTTIEPDSITTPYGNKVKYRHAAYRTSPDSNDDSWLHFGSNMRVEVRYKRSDHQGFNNALWFMGNEGKWPDCGEIDLLENPKKKVNNRAHFTLHSKNHYAGVMGGGGSVSKSVALDDMKDWNIYWVEILPETIRGGINGLQFFEHNKGDGGNTDWPWDNPAGFFMLITTGISTETNRWPGAVDSSQWLADEPPMMSVDWIRVYTNSDYDGPAPANKYY